MQRLADNVDVLPSQRWPNSAPPLGSIRPPTHLGMRPASTHLRHACLRHRHILDGQTSQRFPQRRRRLVRLVHGPLGHLDVLRTRWRCRRGVVRGRGRLGRGDRGWRLGLSGGRVGQVCLAKGTSRVKAVAGRGRRGGGYALERGGGRDRRWAGAGQRQGRG